MGAPANGHSRPGLWPVRGRDPSSGQLYRRGQRVGSAGAAPSACSPCCWSGREKSSPARKCASSCGRRGRLSTLTKVSIPRWKRPIRAGRLGAKPHFYRNRPRRPLSFRCSSHQRRFPEASSRRCAALIRVLRLLRRRQEQAIPCHLLTTALVVVAALVMFRWKSAAGPPRSTRRTWRSRGSRTAATPHMWPSHPMHTTSSMPCGSGTNRVCGCARWPLAAISRSLHPEATAFKSASPFLPTAITSVLSGNLQTIPGSSTCTPLAVPPAC